MNEPCYWCRRSDITRTLPDPYDTVYGFEGKEIPLCPYCYAYRLAIAFKAATQTDIDRAFLDRLKPPR